MSEAIVRSTKPDGGMQFDHVAMFATVRDSPVVIEASAKDGVVIRKWDVFLSDAKNGVVVKRINHKVDMKAAVRRAMSFAGQPYDWSYMPGNGKMYCSELIYNSFIDSDGNRLFKEKPMSFRDAEGNTPRFWIELFRKSGEPIPEGIPGTNPNDMAKETFLDEIYIYKPQK